MARGLNYGLNHSRYLGNHDGLTGRNPAPKGKPRGRPWKPRPKAKIQLGAPASCATCRRMMPKGASVTLRKSDRKPVHSGGCPPKGAPPSEWEHRQASAAAVKKAAPRAPKTTGGRFTARHPGFCPLCSTQIMVGHKCRYVSFEGKSRAAHERCAASTA